MPEGRTIPYTEQEYPELGGIEPGRSVKFSGEAVIEDLGGENRGLKITSMTFETENQADKELKGLKGTPETYASESESEVEL